LSGDWQSCPRFLATIDYRQGSGSGRQRLRSAADHAQADLSRRPDARSYSAQQRRPEREPAHRRVPVVFWVLLGVALAAMALAVLKPWAPGQTWLASALG